MTFEQDQSQFHQNQQNFLVDSLLLSIDSDKQARLLGVERLESLQSSQSGGQYLLDLLLLCFPSSLKHHFLKSTLQPSDLAIRQLASLTLKNSVKNIWDGLSENEKDGAIKNEIRAKLIQALSLDRSIRANIALTLARIAHYDWPDVWTGLFDEILSLIQGQNADAIDGSIRFLSEFVREDMSDVSFSYLAPNLLPPLFTIFSNSESKLDLRTGAIRIVGEFVEVIYMVKEAHPEVVRGYLDPILQAWTPGILQVLNLPLPSTSTSPLISLKANVLKTTCTLARVFPKNLESVGLNSALLNSVWKLIEDCGKMYQKFYVHTDEQSNENEIVENIGEECDDLEHSGLDSLIYQGLDYLDITSKTKGGKKILVAGLNSMIPVLVSYLQVTDEMESNWARDVNLFVQDDDDQGVGQSVRIAVHQCLQSFYDLFGTDFIKALLTSCSDFFQLGNQAKLAAREGWWKYHECAMFALGSFREGVIEYSSLHTIDLQNIFSTVAVEDLNCIALPFLQGRTLWFASRFAGALDKNLATRYLEASVQALTSNTSAKTGLSYESMIVRVSSLKAVREFMSVLSRDIIIPHQNHILRCVAEIGTCGIVQEDSLILVLEVFTEAVNINPSALSGSEIGVAELLIKVWKENEQDVFIMELLQDLFSILAGNQIMSAAFQTTIFPHLVQALTVDQFSGTITNLQRAATAIDLITTLIKKVPEPLPSVYTKEVYPHIIQLLMNADDTGLLQNGQELLKALVDRDFPEICSSVCAGEIDGFQALLGFISKMLQPSESEHCAIFIGPLINKVLSKGADKMSPFIPQLLTGVIHRLSTSKMPAFIETLVLIFCFFVQTNCEVVVSFLDSIQLTDSPHKTGLELFLTSWCDVFNDLQGVYHVKVSTLAMMTILATGDPRLNSILVRGDLIIQPNSKKIVTRSMAKSNPDQYQMIPFPVKGLGLILDEFKAQQQSKMKNEQLEVFYSKLDDDAEDLLIASKIDQIITMIDEQRRDGSKPLTVQIQIAFYEKKAKKNWIPGFSGKEDDFWEEWMLHLEVTRSPSSELEQIHSKNALKMALEEILLKISIDSNKLTDHIPPITTADPFVWNLVHRIPQESSWRSLLSNFVPNS